MKAHEFTARLMVLIDSDHMHVDAFDHKIRRVSTYVDAGMLTRDAGLVVETEDGSEFQITIVAR